MYDIVAKRSRNRNQIQYARTRIASFKMGVFSDYSTVRTERKNPGNLHRIGLEPILPIFPILKLADSLKNNLVRLQVITGIWYNTYNLSH